MNILSQGAIIPSSSFVRLLFDFNHPLSLPPSVSHLDAPGLTHSTLLPSLTYLTRNNKQINIENHQLPSSLTHFYVYSLPSSLPPNLTHLGVTGIDYIPPSFSFPPSLKQI